MLRALLQGSFRGLILLAVLGAGWFLYRSISGKSASSAAKGDAVSVSAEQLATAYEANVAQADAQYRGRPLSVAGTIRAVEIGPALKLAGDTPYSTVWARLQSSQAEAVARLAKDARVNLGCVGGGMAQRMPLLYDCVLLP